MIRLTLALISFVLAGPAPLLAQSSATLEVGKFSSVSEGSALPDGWKPLTFPKVPKHTAYSLVKDGSGIVVRAVSNASASGLTKEVRIDPKEYPIVRWRWKIDNLLKTADVATKEGDDYPARLYVTNRNAGSGALNVPATAIALGQPLEPAEPVISGAAIEATVKVAM